MCILISFLCSDIDIIRWIEECVGEELGLTSNFEEALRYGVILAKLTKYFSPQSVKRIFDPKMEQELQFRHSDNTNYFFAGCKVVNFPQIFIFELLDVYDKKNVPKAIYCLHALSHFLVKMGLAPKIKRLVGKLKFTEDELIACEEAILASGVQLPHFGNVEGALAKALGEMGESEQDMNERLMIQFRGKRRTLAKCQAFARRFVYRQRYLRMLEAADEYEVQFNDFQALVHGFMVRRKIQEIRDWVNERYDLFVTFQALCRGFLSRRDYDDLREEMEKHALAITNLQAKIRGMVRQHQYDTLKGLVSMHKKKWLDLQAYSRGLCMKRDLERKKQGLKDNANTYADLVTRLRGFVAKEKHSGLLGEIRLRIKTYIDFQAYCRGFLRIKPMKKLRETLISREPNYVNLQAYARGLIAKRHYQEVMHHLELNTPIFINFQSMARRLMTKTKYDTHLKEIKAQTPIFINYQAYARGMLMKIWYETIKYTILENPEMWIEFQALMRKHLRKSQYRELHRQMKLNRRLYTKFQAHLRGFFQRKQFEINIAEFRYKNHFATMMQAKLRGLMQKRKYKTFLAEIKECEDWFNDFQASTLGWMVRHRYDLMIEYYSQPQRLERVEKIQATVKAKHLSRAYKALMTSDNVPIRVVQDFLHLLDDNDKNSEEERELEILKELVIKKIRDNNETEAHLNELDIKIALLVRNRITLDEVVSASKKGTTSDESTQESSAADIFSSNIKSMDKNSQRKLELYQSMFYILQTQPKYLAKTVLNVKQAKMKTLMDQVLLALFNYANSSRDEYLLLKLFNGVISEEINITDDLLEFLRGNPVFIKMVVYYTRGAKERQYLRDLLQPLINAVIDNKELDLTTDPLLIYQSCIKEEEINTGEASSRPYDVPREEAAKDPEVKGILEVNLKNLKRQADRFLNAMIKSIPKMPYGMRSIAKQLNSELRRKFPVHDKLDNERIWKVVGNLIYYRYLNPAIVAPEGFDVIEKIVNSKQRQNLAEISKLLQQMSTGKVNDTEGDYLASLKSYVENTYPKILSFFEEVVTVTDEEDYFGMSDLSDVATTHKPVVYITPQQIFNTHQLIVDAIPDLKLQDGDALKALIDELGPPPPEAVNVEYYDRPETAEERELGPGVSGKEISLTLSSRFMDNLTANEMGGAVGELILEYKHLFMNAKKFVKLLLRVQAGKNITEMLAKEHTEEESNAYALLIRSLRQQALEQQQKAKDDGLSTLGRDTQLPRNLAQLKTRLIDLLAKLQATYSQLEEYVPQEEKRHRSGIIRITSKNSYQEILSSIASDIRFSNRRRFQRKREIKTMKQTVINLQEKMQYLEEQKESYQDYINGCMAQLTSNKNRKQASAQKYVMPFTPQWYHLQELKKQGKIPQFGSYKYPADQLYKKGVLVSVDGYSPKEFDKVSMTISSDETGVFLIKVSILGVPMPQKVELKLEELLQYQFENKQVIPIFDGAAKVNVNLLIHLINKKFYQ